MPDALGPVASFPVAWALTYLLHSTAVLGAVWALVRFDVVRAPEARDALWKVGVLAGLVTATAGVAVRDAAGPKADLRQEAAVLRLAEDGEARREALALAAVRVASAGERVGPTAASADRQAVPLGAEAAAIEARLTRFTDPCGGSGEAAFRALRDGATTTYRFECRGDGAPWSAVLAGIWLLGAVLLAVSWFVGSHAVRHGLGPLAPAGPRAARALERLGADGRRADAVRVSPHAGSPCVIGRTLVLPDRCERELADEEIEAVLAHETAHLVRRDGAWLGMFELLARLLWIQPLNRVACRGFLDAAELACDDWAVARLARPLDLARSISRVAEWSLPGARSLPATALARARSGLSGRVRRILRGERGGRGGRAVGTAVALSVTAAALALPVVPVARTFEAIVIRRAAEWVGEEGAVPAAARRIHVEIRAAEAP